MGTPKFISFNIHAVMPDGVMPSGRECVTECADDHPQRIAFGLYGIGPYGLLKWIGDFPTREAANQASKAHQVYGCKECGKGHFTSPHYICPICGGE